MSHQTFKVCILIDDNVENFYIKHYLDEINPIFNRFKNQVFNRNPGINTANLKIYWIDSEDDKILVSCEEDFRLYIEQGKGRKIFFCSSTNSQGDQQQQQNEDEPTEVPMDSEDVEHKCDGRKCRKGHKEEEKRRRHARKLAEKLKHYEDSLRSEEDRRSRRPGEKRECKNSERLERAKRRVEQIRSIIGSIDPANLNSSYSSTEGAPSTSTAPQPTATPPNFNEPPFNAVLSPETTRLLSNAIANCFQPCNVINKVLNDVFALIPQVAQVPEEQGAQPAPPATSTAGQQTMDVPKQTTATNTSDANTPVPVRQANDEIEALFKEAAKELEKMNEIVKCSNKMETSTSTSSSTTGVTQIEKDFANITDSAISDSTVINLGAEPQEGKNEGGQDMTDSTVMVATPTKMSRSRESSIEVHDVGSIMSDDSRDWTILSIEPEEVVNEPPPTPVTPAGSRIVDPKTGAIPKAKSVDSSAQVDLEEFKASTSKRDSIKSISIETQTPTSILSDLEQKQLQASVQKSIDICRKSIESIHKSMETPAEKKEQPKEENASAFPSAPVAIPSPTPRQITTVGFKENVYPNLQAVAPAAAVAQESLANVKAKEQPKAKFAPAVIVYDPNPKINAAVHTMMQMGFTNEDNWLTQLLLNVDGDIPKALNFLTPQPKNKKP